MRGRKILIYSGLVLSSLVLLSYRLVRPSLVQPPVKQLIKSVPSSRIIPKVLPEEVVLKEEQKLTDPFQQLPEELARVVVLPSQVSESRPSPIPTIKSVSYPRESYLRGVLLGTVPQALVEEAGNYHQVGLGGTFAGGTVVQITSDRVIVLREQQRVQFKLGEN